MSDNIRIETRDRITRIEIARTDKKNALTQDMYRAMREALAAADADAQVRAILLHGARDCFTAGNDLKDFLERRPGGGPTESFQFISALPRVAKPLVAAVGGPAVGVGTTMLLHCDLVYASPGAGFQMPFVPLGLVPEAASSLL
ncbi:MAG: enoyl-CoA hydratase/isomerase family protein, partial [Burkholderiales bacterium]|nr:enoyl-CoA hydratase/isomerase family protein [Burkholderiales bacterium]